LIEVVAVDAEFIDPLVHVFGRKHIYAQFFALRKLFHSGRILEFECFQENERVFFTNVNVEFILFKIPILQIPVRISLLMFINCDLDRHGDIVKHQDHWSISGVIEKNFSTFYNLYRSTFGTISSIAILFLKKSF
jgi:hypothetical protein